MTLPAPDQMLFEAIVAGPGPAQRRAVAKAITLEVTPEQSMQIALAEAAGTVQLALRQVGDVKPVALERGEAAVLYVTGSGSSLSPVWVKRPVSTR